MNRLEHKALNPTADDMYFWNLADVNRYSRAEHHAANPTPLQMCAWNAEVIWWGVEAYTVEQFMGNNPNQWDVVAWTRATGQRPCSREEYLDLHVGALASDVLAWNKLAPHREFYPQPWMLRKMHMINPTAGQIIEWNQWFWSQNVYVQGKGRLYGVPPEDIFTVTEFMACAPNEYQIDVFEHMRFGGACIPRTLDGVPQ